MRVRVDHDVCESHGKCEAIAPDVFKLRDDDILSILQPKPGPEAHDRVRKAVDACPKVALSIIED